MIDIFTAGISIALTVLIGLGIYFFYFKKKYSNSGQDLNHNIEIAELREKLKMLKKEKVNLGLPINENKQFIESSEIISDKEKQKFSNTSLANVHDEINESIIGNREKQNRPEGNNSGQISESQELLDLKKKLSSLEEENEELNNAYVNLKKKSKQKSEEVDELVIKLSDSKKNNVQLETIKFELEKTNNEIKTQLKEKQNSLGFVNGILNASSSSSRDFEEISNKTWGIYSFISTNSEVIELNDNDMNEAWQWMNNENKTWLKNKTTVAIVGEFSAGKTTIVNTILKANDPKSVLLPTHSDETTAIPTYISNGKEFNCEFYTPDGELKNVSKEIFQNVTKTALDNVNVSSLIKYFVLKYPNKNLEKISILDTPGFGSIDKNIINRTTEVVKETDALFWVIDINQGELNESSVKVIKEHLGDIPLYVILNKADGKSPEDREKSIQKIVETLKNKQIKCTKIITFSNKEPPNVILDLIKEIKKAPSVNIIGKIDNNLRNNIGDFKKELFKIQNKEKDLSNKCDKVGSNFIRINNKIKYNIIEATELFKHSKPLIGSNSYKMMENDKDKFDNYINFTLIDLNEYPKQIDTYLDYNNELKTIINKKSDTKGEIKYYEGLLKTFNTLVNQYDPKLLKAQ